MMIFRKDTGLAAPAQGSLGKDYSQSTTRLWDQLRKKKAPVPPSEAG
jgi:hypothetical protein